MNSLARHPSIIWCAQSFRANNWNAVELFQASIHPVMERDIDGVLVAQVVYCRISTQDLEEITMCTINYQPLVAMIAKPKGHKAPTNAALMARRSKATDVPLPARFLATSDHERADPVR